MRELLWTPPGGATYVQVATLDLPAGSYMVTARTVITNNYPAGKVVVTCYLGGLTSGAAALDSATIVVASLFGTGSRMQTLTLLGATTLASAGGVGIYCEGFPDSPPVPTSVTQVAAAGSASIGAISVQSLFASAGP